MSIRFSCAGCGAQLKVSDEKAGSSGKCPKCGAAIVVPAAALAPVTSASSVAAATPVPSQAAVPSDADVSDFPAIDTDLPRRREPAVHAPGGDRAGYRPASTLTTVTAALLGVLGLLHLGFGVHAVLEFIHLQSVAPYLPVEEMPVSGLDLMLLGVAAVYIPAFITCVVSFCMWTYRVNCNAALLAGRPLSISPGWSVGWYFVPIMNLFRPYQAMKEIWEASGVRRASTNLLTIWWALWIIGLFGDRLSMRLNFSAETAGDLRGCAFLDSALSLTNIGLCIAAFLVVRRLYAMQQQKAGSV